MLSKDISIPFPMLHFLRKMYYPELSSNRFKKKPRSGLRIKIDQNG